MTVLSSLLVFIAAVLLLPSVVLLVQVSAAVLLGRKSKVAVHGQDFSTSPSVDVCLIMPAHNEAAGIAAVLRSLLPQLGQNRRLLVVADNCTDGTADIARNCAGSANFVEVIERQNLELRGKGYALDHGVRHLVGNSPEVVLIVDADCVLTTGAIDVLARQCLESNRPVQALYLMQSPEGAGVKTQLAEFAWLVKNKVRALGYHRLGFPCQLMGTGMAFTWSHISQAQLSTGHIVEDMKLGIDLARKGTPPQFCPDALVTSVFPSAAEGLQTQRTRWEHGHLSVISTQVPRLLWQAGINANGLLLAMALDLCVPPLALLIMLTLGTGLTGLALIGVGGHMLPALLSGLSIVAIGLAVVIAWWSFGRSLISLRQLCHIPLYIVAKVPLYFNFLVKRQSAWIRSKRDGEL